MMRPLRFFILVTFLILLHFWGSAQHIPDLINYKVSEYKAHNQNWAVSQSPDGWMYFANTDGLLVFNGNQWQKYVLPEHNIIRAVYCHQDRVYTGAYGAFGYWVRDACGHHSYTSLAHLVPNKLLDKEEVWHITSDGKDVYFQSFSVLLRYDGQAIHHVKLPGSIMFLQFVNGNKIIQCIDSGLYEIIDDNNHRKIAHTDFFIGKTVTAILPQVQDTASWLITTASDGVFTMKNGVIKPWNARFQNHFIVSQINKCFITDQGQTVMGTIRDGILVFDPNGSLLYHFNTSNGLQNNTVLAILQDRDGDLWASLDKGISHVGLHSPALVYKDVSGKLGTVYSILQANNTLYIGTNQGLYYHTTSYPDYSNEKQDFKLIKGTQGHVWQLLAVGNAVICGHNEGTFSIKGHTAEKISSVTGGWFTLAIADNIMLQGTYTGLVVFKKKGNEWIFSNKISQYPDPVKKVIRHKDNKFWVAGPNTGLRLITINHDFSKVENVVNYGKNLGIRNEQNVEINLLNDKLMVFDGIYHYSYDETKDRFVLDPELNVTTEPCQIRVLGDTLLTKIYSDHLVFINQAGQKRNFPFIVNKDYHNICLIDSNTVGLCLSEGYAIVNLDFLSKPTPKADMVFSLVWPSDGSCTPVSEREKIQLPYSRNSGIIYFHTPEFKLHSTYFSRLKPLDTLWNPIGGDGKFAFNHLPYGNYTFEVKYNNDVYKIEFEIAAPWYLSKWAFLLYAFLTIVLIWWMKLMFDRQLTRQKLRLEQENVRMLRERMIEMENDRLYQDNIAKSKDLANATMHLIQKNELIQEIKDELIQIRKSGDQTLTAHDFRNMMNQINENLTVQDDKNLFDANFEEVHADFLGKLKKEYTQLTADDLKLAAYIRMNLSSKEIAPLFNISIRGLENKRYRLRKKMNLPMDTNLTDFFENYL